MSDGGTEEAPKRAESDSVAADRRCDGHRCPAQRCGLDIPPDAFMCPSHWALLPAPLREAITGTCPAGRSGEALSPQHAAYAQAAIAAVAHHEARANARTPSRPRAARKPVQLALFELPAPATATARPRR